MQSFAPYSPSEVMDLFHEERGSINKHLLVIYSAAIGLDAKRVLELGIGLTTRTLRGAMQVTGGKLFSCDCDHERYGYLLEEAAASDDWELHLCDSMDFIGSMEGPFELAMHDGAHDYRAVRKDLERILPMMRRYGLVFVHDSQQEVLGTEMMLAIKDATRNYRVSAVSLPYQHGLTILRVEDSDFEPHPTFWKKSDSHPGTRCFPSPTEFADSEEFSVGNRLVTHLKAALRSFRPALRPLRRKLRELTRR